MKRPVGFLAQGAAIRVSASAAFGSGDRLREGTHRGRNPSKNFSLDLQINDAMITTTWHRFLDFDLRLVNKEINQPIKKKKEKKTYLCGCPKARRCVTDVRRLFIVVAGPHGRQHDDDDEHEDDDQQQDQQNQKPARCHAEETAGFFNLSTHQ